MWVLIIAAAAQSASGSGKLVHIHNTNNLCVGESYWVSYVDEQGLRGTDGEKAYCVPTAAGNLISALAEKIEGLAYQGYPYNFGLDFLVNDTNPRYVYGVFQPQRDNEYYLGGQTFLTAGGYSNAELSLVDLMKTDPNSGTSISDARTGLQQYLDNSNRLKRSSTSVVRVVGKDRPDNVKDTRFLRSKAPNPNPAMAGLLQFNPYILHINQNCLRATDFQFHVNPGASLKINSDPLPKFHESTKGHAFVVYRHHDESLDGHEIQHYGASGLRESRHPNNYRDCSKSGLSVFSDQTCVEGITFIEEHTHCPNFESYWVRLVGEVGHEPMYFPGEAYCVPTAAGNLITHLAAKKYGKLEAYPFNYGLDFYARSGPFSNNAAYQYPLYEPYDLTGIFFLSGQTRAEYYLGGQQWYGQPLNDKEKYSLVHTMKTDLTTGTRLDDARIGLQLYLFNTKRLGQYHAVHQINRTSEQSDYIFLKNISPPYMLHINQTCLKEDDYRYPDHLSAHLLYRQSWPATFYGSTMGHTIVVYNVDSGRMDFIGLKFLKLSGASGLRNSRTTDQFTENQRGCDNTDTFVYDNQKCVVGVTYIVMPTPSPTSSPTPKMGNPPPPPSPTPLPTPPPVASPVASPVRLPTPSPAANPTPSPAPLPTPSPTPSATPSPPAPSKKKYVSIPAATGAVVTCIVFLLPDFLVTPMINFLFP